MTSTPIDLPVAVDGAKSRKTAHEANKLSKRLHRQVGQAIADFNMIEAPLSLAPTWRPCLRRS